MDSLHAEWQSIAAAAVVAATLALFLKRAWKRRKSPGRSDAGCASGGGGCGCSPAGKGEKPGFRVPRKP